MWVYMSVRVAQCACVCARACVSVRVSRCVCVCVSEEERGGGGGAGGGRGEQSWGRVVNEQSYSTLNSFPFCYACMCLFCHSDQLSALQQTQAKVRGRKVLPTKSAVLTRGPWPYFGLNMIFNTNTDNGFPPLAGSTQPGYATRNLLTLCLLSLDSTREGNADVSVGGGWGEGGVREGIIRFVGAVV